ncbi:MAG: esterase [Caldilineaceae bacterium]
MSTLVTTLGDYPNVLLGTILPHEHIFVDLGPIEAASYQHADCDEVVRVMTPYIESIQQQGVGALVECTPVGVGRRVDIVLAVSQATQFPVVVATGIYREPWVPLWAHQASEDELAEWMLQELNDGIEATGVRAAWIKLSAGDDGITPCEAKILRAASRAGKTTGAVIGSHTICGRVVKDQLDIIEAAGYRPDRFIWIHTQVEPDFELHLAMARRGCWIEYDSIGSANRDDLHIERILRLLDAGLGHRLLLSHDRGWYDPSKPHGGTQLPYTYLVETFLPKLRRAGVDEATIQHLTVRNPFLAFAR